jgi:hypothetical protein
MGPASNGEGSGRQFQAVASTFADARLRKRLYRLNISPVAPPGHTP